MAHAVSGDYMNAIEVLTALVSRSGATSVDVLNDLAALRLEQARSTRQAYAAASALDWAQKALSIDPLYRPAIHNRALALRELGLGVASELAWDHYMSVEPVLSWRSKALKLRASEAAARRRPTLLIRQRLASALAAHDVAVVRDLVHTIPQAAREHLEDNVLPEWARATIEGDRSNSSALALSIGTLASLLHARHGERGWLEVAEAIAKSGDARRRRLAAVLISQATVRTHIAGNRLAEARRELQRTKSSSGRVAALQAGEAFWNAYLDWHDDVPRAQVARELRRLAALGARRGYVYVQARARFLEATTLDSLTRYSEALASYNSAVALFIQSGEYEYAASTYAPLGTHLAMQGDLPAAWASQRAANAWLDDIESPRRRFVVLAHAVILATRFGLPHAALSLQDLLVDEQRSGDDASLAARQLIERARLHLDLGLVEAGKHDVEAATQAVHAIADKRYRLNFEEDLRFQRARAIATSDPALGAELMEGMAQGAARTGRLHRVAEVRLARGRAWRQAGRTDDALREWMAGIAQYEAQRLTIADEQARIQHFALAASLYDEAVAALVDRDDLTAALALVARSHARVLLESAAERATPGPAQRALLSLQVTPPFRVAQALPRETLVLVYHALPDRLLVWSLARDGVAMSQTRVPASELRRLSLQASGRMIAGEGEASLSRLSEALLGGVVDRLSRARSVVVVPHPVLSGVPFAALPHPATNKALVESIAIAMAPSLALLDERWGKAPENGRCAQVAHAAFFAPGLAAGVGRLASLPGSQREIAESASVYTAPSLFVEGEATASRFLEALGTQDVVHFAGHALSNAEFPLRSTLVMREDDARGEVHLDLIAAQHAVRTRLVVLAACSTATGEASFGEGVLSLARPFVVAGVPAVLGTLWDIEDRAGRAVMPRFHAWYQRGVGAAEALRSAQRELRASEDAFERDPATWAAFVVVGGREAVVGTSCTDSRR